MSITYAKSNNELLLYYSPEGLQNINYVITRLNDRTGLNIRKTFFVNKNLLREINDPYDFYDPEETFCFCIGKIGPDYTEIDNDVIPTNHHFFFANDINIRTKLFIASRNISILPKIDRLIDRDFYVGGNWEQHGGIPEKTYMELLDSFPKTSEIDKYCHMRISTILQEFFPECDRYKKIYYQFIEKKRQAATPLEQAESKNYNAEIEYAQFSAALTELEQMLTQSDTIRESIWQKKVHNILRLIYPKYILCSREITFPGIDGYDKRPDFTLVDMNGFVDLLEIKRPTVRILTEQASYRNNYVPTREFSGAVQQMEKYIFCLTTIEKSQTAVTAKLVRSLPKSITPQIVNPQGILLLGRSEGFNQQQQQDFELIKRQYKNIADIMTYDDLLSRLRNIVAALRHECNIVQ